MRRAAEATAAPYFSLARAAWIPCIAVWDVETGEVRRREGSRDFASYREALQASRVLARLATLHQKLGSTGADCVVSIEEAQ